MAIGGESASSSQGGCFIALYRAEIVSQGRVGIASSSGSMVTQPRHTVALQDRRTVARKESSGLVKNWESLVLLYETCRGNGLI
jgi:hypothetical protein